jgi:hypothetical protein
MNDSDDDLKNSTVGNFSSFAMDEEGETLDGFEIELNRYESKDLDGDKILSFSVDIENYFGHGMSSLSLHLTSFDELKELADMLNKAIEEELAGRDKPEAKPVKTKFDTNIN